MPPPPHAPHHRGQALRQLPCARATAGPLRGHMPTPTPAGRPGSSPQRPALHRSRMVHLLAPLIAAAILSAGFHEPTPPPPAVRLGPPHSDANYSPSFPAATSFAPKRWWPGRRWPGRRCTRLLPPSPPFAAVTSSCCGQLVPALLRGELLRSRAPPRTSSAPSPS
jgi:hypothetical protein